MFDVLSFGPGTPQIHLRGLSLSIINTGIKIYGQHE